MLIGRERCYFHPIDWSEPSIMIHCPRALGWCERCRCPHGRPFITSAKDAGGTGMSAHSGRRRRDPAGPASHRGPRHDRSDQGGAGHDAPRPRHAQQRGCEPHRVLPTLPYAARPARASAAALAHAVPTQCPARPITRATAHPNHEFTVENSKACFAWRRDRSINAEGRGEISFSCRVLHSSTSR